MRKSFEDKHVLRGVSVDLEKGTTLAIMGGSGTGKTVLLRIIDGLVYPDAGQVSLFGTRIDSLREEQMLPLRRRAGFVFQGAALFDSMSVFENVAFPLREHTRRRWARSPTACTGFLGLVGLPGHRRPPARRAVGGHAQARGHRAGAGDGARGRVLRRADRGPGSDERAAGGGADRPAPPRACATPRSW